MGRLQKIAYCVGIGIALSVFVLFLYSFLPHQIQNNAWDNLDVMPLDKEELLKKFQEHPAYAAFYEKYPDANEEINYNKNANRGGLEVGIRNSENGNTLMLQMHYNTYEDNINVNINCNKSPEPNRYNHNTNNAHGLFVIDFIEQTDCLELETDQSKYIPKDDN